MEGITDVVKAQSADTGKGDSVGCAGSAMSQVSTKPMENSVNLQVGLQMPGYRFPISSIYTD